MYMCVCHVHTHSCVRREYIHIYTHTRCVFIYIYTHILDAYFMYMCVCHVHTHSCVRCEQMRGMLMYTHTYVMYTHTVACDASKWEVQCCLWERFAREVYSLCFFLNVLVSFIGLFPYVQVSFHIKLHDLDDQAVDVHDSTQVHDSLSPSRQEYWNRHTESENSDMCWKSRDW